MKEQIHFAHGNGFPSLCYRQLLNGLEKRYECFCIDKIGHNERYPVTENWHYLVDEVLDSIKRQATQPVIAIGHSLGGVLSLMAAIEEPDLFKVIILLDSPLLGRFKSSMVLLAKALGVIDRVTPASQTRTRRQCWRNRDQVIHYLEQKELFKTFTDECLQDYIDYGMEQTEEGYFLLRFDRNIEYLIYRTLPHTLHKYAGRLKVPTALIYGDKSAVINPIDVRYMEKNYNIQNIAISGTHMFPMEKPNEVVKCIFSLLDKMLPYKKDD